MTEISSCPFCGSGTGSVEYNGAFTDRWSVKCLACETRGPRSNDKEVAIHLWNGRGLSRSTPAMPSASATAEARNRVAGEQELERYRSTDPWPESPLGPVGG